MTELDQKILRVAAALDPAAASLYLEAMAHSLPPASRDVRNEILAKLHGTTPAEIAAAFDRIAAAMAKVR